MHSVYSEVILIAGKRDLKVLAAFAKWRLRRKLSELDAALTGQCTPHHARLIHGDLERIDLLDRQIADLNLQLGDLVAPLATQMEQLTSLPGVEMTATRVILAEIGTDMSRVGADTRLASWAEMCLGNDESAGKRRWGRTRKGNRYLGRVLVQCAWAARKTPTYMGRTFRRLEPRLGGKKAATAVGHKILGIVCPLRAEETFYDEGRYDPLQPRQEEQQRKLAVKALERLGYQVALARYRRDKASMPHGDRGKEGHRTRL